jgi:tetratricopeptide (TPR) repeat protein
MPPPVVGADDFAKGCQLYNDKNYKQAEPILSETVKKYPKYWPGHYYLAHTLLALGQHAAARKEYEACMTCQPAPGADVISSCQKVIVSLGGTLPEPGSSTESTTPLGEVKPADGKMADSKPADGKAAVVEKEAPESYRDKERRWHIERLRKMCSEKIAALREELKEALDYATSQASTYYKIDPEKFGNSIQLSPEERARIEKDYQDKITKVQEDTEREIKGLN